MHSVAVVALADVIAFDLTTAVEVFGRVVLPSGEPGYRVLVCGTAPVVSAGPMRIATDHGIADLDGADTIVVPGRNDVTAGTSDDVLRALKSAYARGTRIDRLDLLGRFHSCRGGAARRQASDHALARGRPVPRYLPRIGS
jgi:transcriptional regulator GlxA family with amidase domain